MEQACATDEICNIDDESSNDEEQPCKRRRHDESINNDVSVCLICYEEFCQSGDHRISSLRCGHIFGHKCILRWLQENKSCPACKTNAAKRDIRHIYANKLVAVDNCELTRLNEEVQQLKAKNEILNMDLIANSVKMEMLKRENQRQNMQIEALLREKNLKSTPAQQSFTADNRFSLKHFNDVVVCPQSTSRVMDYVASKGTLMASQTSPNPLFPGFGVRHFNVKTLAALMYSPLHSKVIRDLKFNQSTNALLSVSADNTFCISHPFSNASVSKQSCTEVLWSCCWDSGNSNIFYIGGQQGSVKVYDMRNITSTLHTYAVPGDCSPVVSVVSIPASAGAAMPLGGIIAAKLNSLWAFETSGDEHKSYLLPVEGPLVSLCYDSVDNHLLVSARPNRRELTARNILCRLVRDADAVSCERIHTFTSGNVQKHLVRSSFIYRATGNCIATPNDCNLHVWNAQTGYAITTAKTQGIIMDTLPLSTPATELLVALTERKLQIFKMIDT